MNILGRLAGGLLIFVGLGWLATLAGLTPFASRSANQFNAQPVTNTAPLTAGSIPANKAIAGGTTSGQTVVGQTSNGQTILAPAGTVETDPRNAAAPTPSPSAVPLATTTTTTTVASPTPTTTVVAPVATPAPAAPVPAGW